MTKAQTSITRELDKGLSRKFSSFDDLLQMLIENGVVDSLDQLIEKQPALLGSLLFEWYMRGQVACAFAQSLAKDHINWQTLIIRESFDLEEFQKNLEAMADDLEALQILFVGEATQEKAIEILSSLCTHPGWSCHEISWMDEEEQKAEDVVMVGLRWHRTGADYSSWVLGVAPFETMPFTRRFEGAPFVALVLRPGPPTTFIAKKAVEGGVQASHLAHMNDGFGEDEEKRKRTDRLTSYQKQTLLAQDKRSPARAKVTFTFEGKYRAQLEVIMSPL